MIEVNEVRHNGELIGFAMYATVSDAWYRPIAAARTAEALDHAAHHGPWRCTCVPTSEFDNAALVWVDVKPGDEPGRPARLLACLVCRVLVTPPHDGYAYLNYPSPWDEK